MENIGSVEQRIEAAREVVMSQTGLMHREFGKAKPGIKHDGTKVTPVDLAISKNIQDEIQKRFPGDQFFSEELAPAVDPAPVTSRFCWVLDPIDGTNNYAGGIIYCAISLALLENGFPVYGVIYDMARRVLIQGGPGRGVWDGERRVQPNTAEPDRHSMVGFHSPVDKSHADEGRRLIETFKIRGLGSSTLHLAYAAVGLLNGVVDHNNKVWDIAAACALLGEAGAEIAYLGVVPFPLREFSINAPRIQYVAGNPAMVKRLRAVLGR